MGRLQDITSAVQQMDGAEFQEMCDQLFRANYTEYRGFTRSGSIVGKRKTRKGTPDALLLESNGNYVFVESSTNSTRGVRKLKDDVRKCLSTEKTDIPLDAIQRIVIYTNFPLSPQNIESLRQLGIPSGIRIDPHDVHDISMTLQQPGCRQMVREYLGLAFDTGQIVPRDTFIEEYNVAAGGLATSLTTEYLPRENDATCFSAALHKHNIVVVTGHAGVGKTKFAIEECTLFANAMDYTLHCISDKNAAILEDLNTHIGESSNHILFVDDANRISCFKQIISFMKQKRTGRLKLVLTVRTYALDEIQRLCRHNNGVITLEPLSDDDITKIITVPPLGITHGPLVRRIVSVSDGNPRLAMMMARLILEKNISVVYNLEEVFEKYYETYLQDQSNLNDNMLVMTMAITWFFYALPLDREYLGNILEPLGMDADAFIERIHQLEKMQLVEIAYGYVRIGEQNLGLYYFHSAFIKRTLLSLSTLLSTYYETYSDRFNDCLNASISAFGSPAVKKIIRTHLVEHYKHIQQQQLAILLCQNFPHCLESEILHLATTNLYEIGQYSAESHIDYQQTVISTINLLAKLYHRSDTTLRDALELSFEFARNMPDTFDDIAGNITRELVFDKYDMASSFVRQTQLLDTLVTGVRKGNTTYIRMAGILIPVSLSLVTYHIELTRRNRAVSDNSIHYDTDDLQVVRSNFWHEYMYLLDLGAVSYTEGVEMYSRVLINSFVYRSQTITIARKDMQYLSRMVNGLQCTETDHCIIRHKYIDILSRYGLNDCSSDTLPIVHATDAYHMLCHVDRNLHVSQRTIDVKIRSVKAIASIRQSYTITDAREAEIFYGTFCEACYHTKAISGLNGLLGIVLEEAFARNSDTGLRLFDLILTDNPSGYLPSTAVLHHLTEYDHTLYTWTCLDALDIPWAAQWQYALLISGNYVLTDGEYRATLPRIIRQASGMTDIDLDRIVSIARHDPAFIRCVLETIIEVNEMKDRLIMLNTDEIGRLLPLITDMGIVLNIYRQQERIDDCFDEECDLLKAVVQHDPELIVEYILDPYKIRASGHYDKKLDWVWSIDSAAMVLERILDTFADEHMPVSIDSHCLSNIFRVTDGMKSTVHAFLFDYAVKNACNWRRVDLVVDIVRNTSSTTIYDMVRHFVKHHKDVELFKSIWWLGQINASSLDFGNLEISIWEARKLEWERILAVVGSIGGYELIGIKKYIRDQIDENEKAEEDERLRRFIRM